jgi:hypothetical protein
LSGFNGHCAPHDDYSRVEPGSGRPSPSVARSASENRGRPFSFIRLGLAAGALGDQEIAECRPSCCS